MLDRVDQLVSEIVSLYVQGGHLRVAALQVVADGVKQMGFSQAGVSVNEQGVVGAGRISRHRQRGGVGEFIGGAYDIGVKGELIFRVDSQVVVWGRLLFAGLVGNGKDNVDARAENLVDCGI